MTRYVVLRQESEGLWRADGPIQDATGSEQAIRRAVELRVESDVDPDGTYVAVPMRSFDPQPVKVEPTVKVSIGSGS